MSTERGKKFGGYSPFQIKIDINGYVADPTMKSFLFSYNKKS